MKSRKKKGFMEAFCKTYLEFSSNTGIHGLKYVTEKGRRVVERVLWVVVAVLGLISAIFMASTFWERFSDSPTRASVETNHYPTWRIPFPAVTLCNANRIFRSRAEELVKKLRLNESLSDSEAMKRVVFLGELVQTQPNREKHEREMAEFQEVLDRNNYTVRTLMQELGEPCKQLLERCKWEGDIRDCSELFEERKSYQGFCCSFNYRGVTEDTEIGRKKIVQVNKEVLHTRYYSHRMGLTVLLNPLIHDYLVSTLFSGGVRMLVHQSDDYPDDTAIEKMLPVRRELLLRVTATSQYCTEEVKNVRMDVRDCVFQDERWLRFFPVYSAINCVTECRMNHTLRYCNCSPFYYHHSGDSRICNLKDIPCLSKYYYVLRTRTPDKWSGSYNSGDQSITCDCPDVCNEVTYDVQTSSGDFLASQYQRTPFFSDGMNVTDRTLFHFYFGDHVSVRTRRDIISSWNDLLSSLGGIFSLFLGCSFMSCVELFYFFTLRLCLRMRASHVIEPQVERVQEVSTVHQNMRRRMTTVKAKTRHGANLQENYGASHLAIDQDFITRNRFF